MFKRFGSHFRHNVVAYLALFFAMSGTAMAAKLITGAEVQDGSLTGADVSDNSTLKGVDIDESDLGKVPSAVNADNAANADKLDGKDASELGGSGKPFLYTLEADTAAAGTYSATTLMPLDNGLELQAQCRLTGNSTIPMTVAIVVSNPEPDGRWEASGTMSVDSNADPAVGEALPVSGFNDDDPGVGQNRLWLQRFAGIGTHFMIRPTSLGVPGPWVIIDAYGILAHATNSCTISGTVTYPE